jgi:hypothetical protein
MKFTLIMSSILLSLSAFASGNIKSATLKCQDDDLKQANVFVIAELQISDGNHTMSINKLILPVYQEAADMGLGTFNRQDRTRWEGNEMSATTFRHTVQYQGEAFQELARFGFQEIGSQVIGYLYYESDADEGIYEGLLTCEKVIVTE